MFTPSSLFTNGVGGYNAQSEFERLVLSREEAALVQKCVQSITLPSPLQRYAPRALVARLAVEDDERHGSITPVPL